MVEPVLSAEARGEQTKGALRSYRAQGKIPGVVYGKRISGERVYIDEKQLTTLLKEGAGRMIRLNLPRHGEQRVMVGEVQRDVLLQDKIVHIDFHQIEMNEKVKTTVRLELTGEAEGVREGGILQQLSNTVEIRCLPGEIPVALEVDVSRLGIGEHLFVRDLRVPEGVEMKSDENEIVVTVLAPQKELPEASDEIRDEDVAVDTAEKIEARKD